MNKFKFGDKVWHEVQGEGVVISDDNEKEFTVHFKEYPDDEFTCDYEDGIAPATDWVKCSERLPKHGDMVLVFNGNSIEIDALAIGEFDFECWCDSVTHWMPLPTPPQD